MPAVIVPKTRLLTGPGFLYKAPVGTQLPGQIVATVTNKAVTSNVATLTTAAAHGIAVGDEIIVDIDDAVLDGRWTTVTGTATTSIVFNVTTANVTSTAATGTAVSYDAGGTVVGGVFTDAWPAGWTLIGVTKEGHEWTYAASVGAIEVAEYLITPRYVTEGVESKVSFEIAEFTAANLSLGLNGGVVTPVSGTGATTLSRIEPPVIGGEIRKMIGWESEDSTERRIYMQGLQSGDNAVNHKKGTDNATIGMEFSLEQPPIYPAFQGYYAGTTPLGN